MSSTYDSLPTPAVQALPTPAVEAILRQDVAFWTGAYVDPCGHSHATRLRHARERLARLALDLAGEPDAAVEYAAVAGCTDVRDAARAELHRRAVADWAVSA